MVKRRPHSATLSWSTVTHSSGVPAEGSASTKVIECMIQPKTQSGRYITSPDGDKIDIKFIIYANLFTDPVPADIPKGATILLPDGIEYKIIRMDAYQKHVEIVC